MALSLNLGLDTDVIYFDFAKAFDSVNHDVLLHKLKTNFKIDGLLLRFLVNYLRDRKQRVIVGNNESTFRNVNSGVPQGSILGPLLFVLFINDLPDGLSPGTNIAMYADDTKIWRSILSSKDCHILQMDINYMLNWAVENKMNFHPNKCKVLAISAKRFSFFDVLPFSQFFYFIGNNILDFTETENDLGVTVTSKLNWNEHCNKLYSKANMMLGLTKRTAHFVNNEKQRRVLYLSLVRSQFGHCSPVWKPTSKTLIEKLESLQKRSIKWILSEELYSYSAHVYFQKCKLLNILPLQFWLVLNDLILFQKIVNRLCPISLPSYLNFFSGSCLRASHYDRLSIICNILPRSNSYSLSSCNPFTNSFFYRTHSIWNLVPFNIREISCPINFKHKIIEYVWTLAREHYISDLDDSADYYNDNLFDDGG